MTSGSAASTAEPVSAARDAVVQLPLHQADDPRRQIGQGGEAPLAGPATRRSTRITSAGTSATRTSANSRPRTVGRTEATRSITRVPAVTAKFVRPLRSAWIALSREQAEGVTSTRSEHLRRVRGPTSS